jgi:hypothetical protein
MYKTSTNKMDNIHNIVQCWVSLIPLCRLMYNVWGTWSLYVTGLRYLSLLNTKCNVLGYWRRRSVCYSGLFTTSLVVTTISVYSVLWPSDFVSRSGPSISSLLSVRRFLFSDFISVSLLCLSLLCSLFYLSSFSVPVSESYVTTDGQSASLSWYKAPIWGLRPNFFSLPSDSCGFVDMGRSLWREDGSVVYNCFRS